MFPKLLVGIAGLFVAFLGYQEYELTSKATSEPELVDLADLEAGRVPENTHLEIGEHWKLWDELIYSFRLREGEKEGPQTKLDYVFYPVISNGHPHSLAWDEPPAGYADWSEVPENRLPVLKSFAVLVRTEQFGRIADLPEDGTWTFDEGLSGMVVNDVRSLSSDERDMLIGSYPGLDLKQVLIFEVGRKPESMAYCLGMMGIGLLLVLLALYAIVSSTTGQKEGVGDLPPLVKAAEVGR